MSKIPDRNDGNWLLDIRRWLLCLLAGKHVVIINADIALAPLEENYNGRIVCDYGVFVNSSFGYSRNANVGMLITEYKKESKP